jgi:PIN domain nuclease of toxin-antitoxin system
VRAERTVLDASALLAFLFDEPGADKVREAVTDTVMLTVNWSEVCQWLLRRGAHTDRARVGLSEAGMELEPLSVVDAEGAARLRADTLEAGLSLADRCCLAFARRLRRPVLTADAAWAEIDVGADVRLIR